MRKTLMRTWRGNELPGGPCSGGVMVAAKPEGKASAKFAGGASVSTNRFDGSTATEATAPDVGCEWLQQCAHASIGRSKAISLLNDSVRFCGVLLVGIASAWTSESASGSISISSIVIPAISWWHDA